jgi:hypothetical protein
MKFFIWTPEYNEFSGGIMSLHILAKMLADKDNDVTVSSKDTMKNSRAKTNKNESLSEDTMVIYPEIITGNPYNSKHVTRWLLNTPGVIGGDGVYDENDLIYKYSEYFKAPDESKVKGILTTFDAKMDIFYDMNLERSGECYFIHKSKRKKLDKHSIDSINIEGLSNEDLSKVFNTTEIFICYDNMTFRSIQAALCGCISVIIPDGEMEREDFLRKSKLHKYGIAFGLDDIQHAKETKDKVNKYLIYLQEKCEKLVDSYLEDCYDYFNNIK